MLRPRVSGWAVASMTESFLEEGVVGFVVSIITTHTTIIPSLHLLVIQSFQDVLCEVSPSWDENHPSKSIPTTRQMMFKRNVEMMWRGEEKFPRNVFEIFSYPYRKKWGWSWFIRKLHATVVRSSYCWATVVEWSLSRAIFRLCMSNVVDVMDYPTRNLEGPRTLFTTPVAFGISHHSGPNARQVREDPFPFNSHQQHLGWAMRSHDVCIYYT